MKNILRCAFFRLLFVPCCLLIAACDQEISNRDNAYGKGEIIRPYDDDQLVLGRMVFARNCALCHGENAQGAQNWRKRDADGHFPPPPLNGSGHAWHHSTDFLRNIIKHGSPEGKGKMPAWMGKLSDQEVDASIAWFQSLWPDQVYDVWYKRGQL